MVMPTVSRYGSPAVAGNDRISAAPIAMAASRMIGESRDSEPLRKSSSEEALGPNGQCGKQREIESGLGPGRPERDLEQAHRHAERHGGDRRSHHTAEPAHDDD